MRPSSQAELEQNLTTAGFPLSSYPVWKTQYVSVLFDGGLAAAEAAGLPVGVMVVGRRFGDDQLLALARTYERRYGWVP